MKKGFTLIELLAVIVILSIVAVITIPVIGGVINTGRESALEKSTNFYIKELETNFSEWVIEGVPLEYQNTDGYAIFDVRKLNKVLKLEGTVPESGSVKINNDYSASNYYYGFVIEATLNYEGGYVVTYTYNTDDNYVGDRSNMEINKN